MSLFLYTILISASVMMKSFASCFVIMTFILSCHTGNSPMESPVGEDAFSADSIKKHVAVLAADSFMGRKPFTEGERLTVDYLQQQFASMDH